jgi:DNA-binding transcriptional LysR family regulator
MLPVALAQPAVDEERLVRVLPDLGQRGGAIYLVHPAMKHLPRRVQLLRDFLMNELKAKYDGV